MLFTIWAFCFLGQTFIVKFEGIFDKPTAAFTMAVLLIFIILCAMPFHLFYSTARKEFVITLWEVVKAPFGIVRFKEFLVADIITSFVNPMKDIGYVVCFFTQGFWKTSEVPEMGTCPGLKVYAYAIMIIPFWFRFAQSLRRYKENGLKRNLVNATKYVTTIIIIGFYIAYEETMNGSLFTTYCIVATMNTIFALWWDFYFDWGLLRSMEPNKKLLRSKILFPRWFYYFGLILNTILRFFWIV